MQQPDQPGPEVRVGEKRTNKKTNPTPRPSYMCRQAVANNRTKQKMKKKKIGPKILVHMKTGSEGDKQVLTRRMVAWCPLSWATIPGQNTCLIGYYLWPNTNLMGQYQEPNNTSRAVLVASKTVSQQTFPGLCRSMKSLLGICLLLQVSSSSFHSSSPPLLLSSPSYPPSPSSPHPLPSPAGHLLTGPPNNY